MNPHILCVDDERNVLEALERTLFERFDVDTATSGAEALEVLGRESYAVVVSDMRMPAMNGAQLLSIVRQRHPDTVRILLTGHAEVEAAIAAVNDAGIFRYLVKPCPAEHLVATLDESVELFRLRTAERELINGTLAGVIKLLADVLDLATPELSSRAQRIEGCVRHLVKKLAIQSTWKYELAALVSQLGCAALPTELVTQAVAGATLSAEQKALFEGHPETAFRLLSPIPRMQQVAEMIRLQFREDLREVSDPEVRLGAELLQVAVAWDCEFGREGAHADVIAGLKRHHPELRKDLLELLGDYAFDDVKAAVRQVYLRDLRIGMVLCANIVSKTGAVVLPEGREINLLLLERLKKFSQGAGIVEPIAVRVRTTR